jgi:hypothetical protein
MKFNPLLLVLPLAAMLAGCGGGFSTHADVDPEAEFTGWRTYRWAERTEQGKEDRRVYNYAVEGRVKNGVNRALEARGFREDNTAQPDFLVGWHGFIQGQANFTVISSYYEYSWGWYSPGYVSSQTYLNNWKEGTLMIDIVDAQKNALVWRGLGTGTMGKAEGPEELQKAMDEATEKILRDFPPEQGG